ncbi:hypothetical protein [Mesorhizobium sp.]|uniref:hypothetical protein n=1 Tax=Mesorhizobium sp. TaxID=1871066 RepID=UPI000FE84554|nr:hypothetical protein [Mesorhizobium sp.]RWM25288.1 MAG: hypothetical protein EOR74_20550 [Mesorhizobium sp.]RWM39023.1 MAG: hypothetical protein EOR75_15615 [Mesorhizobium sp.]TJV52473.1 MAG: hypothetical protein E5Y01_08860 [Mesorhizobium sp.]
MGAIGRVTGLKQGPAAFVPAWDRRAFTASGLRKKHMRLSDAADCKQPHTGAELAPSSRSSDAQDVPKWTSRDARIRSQNHSFASLVKARIFRDFLGSGEVKPTAMDFPYFHKPLHFNIKYAFIE